MNAAPLCVLLTDFPLADPYVGAMKGAVLRDAPDARFVDLAHGLPPGDVAWASIQLAAQRDVFPDDAVFLAVVDPGVGTDRRILAAACGRQRFVGPDNGLLVPALREGASIVAVDAAAVRVRHGAETFHGRDVMAPVAARLLRGAPLDSVGVPIADPVAPALPSVRIDDGAVDGVVLHVDGYGNCVTNIEVAALDDPAAWRATVRGTDLGPIRRCYGDVDPGEPLALVGSIGRVEVSVRDGDAARRLGVARGEPVRVVRS